MRSFRSVEAAVFVILATIGISWCKDDEKITHGPVRHRVLRRHLQGHPAFVVGALGNVGMTAPDPVDDDDSFELYAEAVAALALNLYESDQNLNSGYYSKNIMDHHRSKSRLVWTGEVSFNSSPDGGAHLRYQQFYDNQPVKGGNILVHTDLAGRVLAINGEYVDCEEALSKESSTFLAPSEAIRKALTSLNISDSKHRLSDMDSDIALVVDDDLSCCLAYESTISYWDTEAESKSRIRKKDIVYADVVEGTVCTRDPILFDQHKKLPRYLKSSLSSNLRQLNQQQSPSKNNHALLPDRKDDPKASVSTYYCVPSGNNSNVPPRREDCDLISDSSFPINSGNFAVDCAHNYALLTFRYFLRFHERNSLDNYGFPLVSYVLSEEYMLTNAYWNGNRMTYGAGGDHYWPLSQAADVVAHELTHGVTQFSSRLMYHNESGALNEAMSDIFGALVDRYLGAAGEDVWLIGEDVVKSSRPIRDMGNPFRVGHYDYFPSRYQGQLNNGGVHWNSGIVNLAFKLLVTGGMHPRGLSDTNVTGLVHIFDHDENLTFAVAGQIFYCANTRCLTRRSTFLDARHCTASICGATGLPEDDEVIQSIQQAWDAVGVSEHTELPTDAPTQIPTTDQEKTTESRTNPPSFGFSTSFPSIHPSSEPSSSPSPYPTVRPSASPTTNSSSSTSPPSEVPSADSTNTTQPDSINPSPQPSGEPSMAPIKTHPPTYGNMPSTEPKLTATPGILEQLDLNREHSPKNDEGTGAMRRGSWGGMAALMVTCLGFFFCSALRYRRSVSNNGLFRQRVKLDVKFFKNKVETN